MEFSAKDREEFLNFFEMNLSVFQNYGNIISGDINEQLSIRTPGEDTPNSNFTFINKDINEDEIKKIQEGFIEEKLTPNFYVFTNSLTHNLLKNLDSETLYDVVWMRKDLKEIAIGESKDYSTLDIRRTLTTADKDYLDVFTSAYLENDGIGFSFDDSALNVYKNYHTNPRFDEQLFVAYEDNIPVCIASLCFDTNKPNISLIHSVGTSNKHRREGLARKTMSHCIAIAREKDIPKIYLGTMANSPMQIFYESLGFSTFMKMSSIIFP